MLLVVRDTRTARAQLLSGDRVAQELGIVSGAIDVADSQELTAAFPRAVKMINDHLISQYQQQSVTGVSREVAKVMIDQRSFRQGKVLVFCESGNERSACVVAAYLMVLYGLNLVEAMQYVTSQRFCVAYDEDLKHMLLAYQDILTAKRDVIKSRQGGQILAQQQAIVDQSLKTHIGSKRGIEETNDVDMDLDDQPVEMDSDRFEGRRAWAPFHDSENS